MTTSADDEKTGIPTNTGIPASNPADYTGNFGLDEQAVINNDKKETVCDAQYQ